MGGATVLDERGSAGSPIGVAPWTGISKEEVKVATGRAISCELGSRAVLTERRPAFLPRPRDEPREEIGAVEDAACIALEVEKTELW